MSLILNRLILFYSFYYFYNNITELYLHYNELTDISGIKLFKNLKLLNIVYNKIKDISVIQYLKNLIFLNINGFRIRLRSN